MYLNKALDYSQEMWELKSAGSGLIADDQNNKKKLQDPPWKVFKHLQSPRHWQKYQRVLSYQTTK